MDRFAPGSLIADFFRWACSSNSPQLESWFDLCGISRNVRLALDLMESVSGKNQSPQLVSDALPMLAYQVLEALTENLSGSTLTGVFDQSMVQCLSGDQRKASELLKDLQSPASSASLFAMSRNAEQFRSLVEPYVREAGPQGARTASGSVWQVVVVKMEACREAVHAMRHNRLGPMVTPPARDPDPLSDSPPRHHQLLSLHCSPLPRPISVPPLPTSRCPPICVAILTSSVGSFLWLNNNPSIQQDPPYPSAAAPSHARRSGCVRSSHCSRSHPSPRLPAYPRLPAACTFSH